MCCCECSRGLGVPMFKRRGTNGTTVAWDRRSVRGRSLLLSAAAAATDSSAEDTDAGNVRGVSRALDAIGVVGWLRGG